MTEPASIPGGPARSVLARLAAVHDWSVRSVTIALAAAVVLYCLVFGLLVFQKSRTLQNSDDFAQYLQPLWTTAHGEPLRTTWRDVGGPGESLLGLHVELTILLLLPLYHFWTEPEGLLLAQVLIVALAAFPIASTATHLLGRPAYGLFFGLAHLANPFLQRALFYDFHPESMQFAALTWAAACLLQGRLTGFAVAAIFAGLTKEDSWLHLFALGAFAFLFPPRGLAWARRSAVVTMVFSLAALVVSSTLIIPAWRGAPPVTFLVKYPALGDDIVEIIVTFFTRPDVVLGLIWDPVNFSTQARVFAPLLFLPFASIRGLALVAGGTLLACLTERETVKTLSVLYPFSLLFFHPFGAMLGLSALGKVPWRIDTASLRFGASALVGAASVIAMFTYAPTRLRDIDAYQSYFINRFPLGPGFSWDYFADNEHSRIGRRFIRERVPEGVPLTTEYRLSAHVANRRVLRAFGDRLEEWVFFDVNGPHYHETAADFRRVLGSGDYGLVAFENGYTLLRRDAPKGRIADVIRLYDRLVEAESLDGVTGSNAADRLVPSRFARVGLRGVDDPGVLVDEFVRLLGPGSYRAVFTMRTSRSPEGLHDVARLEVRDAAQRPLAHRELTSEDFAGVTDYRPVSVSFELTERMEVEIRARFTSEADVWIDRVEIQDRGMWNSGH
jgi:uncharacterized membrane protein